MTTLDTTLSALRRPYSEFQIDEAQLAVAAFLARYSGRTLEAYRHDLRGFFQWAADVGVAVLEATRPHVELYRSMLEERGLAASTIDRRLSTVCGFYRFAHIDGRIASNPAQYVRRPQVHPTDARGLDRSELGVFLFTAEHYDRHARGARGAARSQWAASQRGMFDEHRGPRHRTRPSHAADRRQGQQACGDPARAAHRAHHRPRGRGTLRGPDPASPRRSAPRPAHRTPMGPLDRQARRARRGAPAHAPRRVHHGRPRRRAFRCETSSSRPATPTREPPRSTTGAARTSTATPPTSSSRSSPAAERSGPGTCRLPIRRH